jgi:hypothetical protein
MEPVDQETPRSHKTNKDGETMVEFLVRIPGTLNDALEQRRKLESTSKAAVIRAALRQYL